MAVTDLGEECKHDLPASLCTYCKPQPAKRPAVAPQRPQRPQSLRTVEARFPGECRCGFSISVGDPLTRDPVEEAWVCEVCAQELLED